MKKHQSYFCFSVILTCHLHAYFVLGEEGLGAFKNFTVFNSTYQVYTEFLIKMVAFKNLREETVCQNPIKNKIWMVRERAKFYSRCVLLKNVLQLEILDVCRILTVKFKTYREH